MTRSLRGTLAATLSSRASRPVGTSAGPNPRGSAADGVRTGLIPIVAAGGFATAESVAATVSSGASAGRVGTAFVATYESRATPVYVEALLVARPGDDTVLTTAFAAGWQDAPHRVPEKCLGRCGGGSARRPAAGPPLQ